MNEETGKAIKAWLNDIDTVAYNLSPEFEEDAKRIRRLVMATAAINYLVDHGTGGLDAYLNEKYQEECDEN